MIQDNQCNRVFFSALLRERCPIAFRGLTEVLERYEVPWSLLEGTNDIWCRDYMPIQVLPNHFMGYDYHPDYLLHNAKDKATITDGICRYIGEDRVLLTNYADFDSRMAVRFRNILNACFKRVEEMKFCTKKKPHKYSWAYINWLQTE